MKMLRPILLVALALALAFAFALAGCGGGGGGVDEAPEAPEAPAVDVPEGQLSVADAKEQGGSGVTVYGTVYVRLDDWMLCHTLDESIYPPGCVEPTLMVSNPAELSKIKLVEGVGQGAGLQWTASPVSVMGDVQGDAITITGTG